MAKMQKLDQKQVPQVIGLGVIAVGVFGYAIFNFALGGPKREANPPTSTGASATSPGASTAASTTAAVSGAANAAEHGTAPTGPGGVQMAQNTAPAIQLPGQYNPDPFRSASKSEAPPVAIKPTTSTGGSSSQGKKASDVAGAANGAANAKPEETEAERAAKLKELQVKEAARMAAIARAVRPEFVVRGTSVVDGANLAIVEVGQEHRVVQPGDVLDNNFRVKTIKLEGVWVTGDNGKDRFFVPVGAKSEQKKADNGLGSPTQL